MKRVLATLQSCVLVALMAATGEGAEFIINDEGAQPMIEWSHETHALKPVSVDPKELKVNYYDKFTIPAICIERMREAMKAVDPYINGRDGFRIYRHSTGETILERQSNWLPDLDKKKQWNDTMEACIK